MIVSRFVLVGATATAAGAAPRSMGPEASGFVSGRWAGSLTNRVVVGEQGLRRAGAGAGWGDAPPERVGRIGSERLANLLGAGASMRGVDGTRLCGRRPIRQRSRESGRSVKDRHISGRFRQPGPVPAARFANQKERMSRRDRVRGPPGTRDRGASTPVRMATGGVAGRQV